MLKDNMEVMVKMRNSLTEMTDEEDEVRVRKAWDNLAAHTLIFADTPEEIDCLRKVTRSANRDLIQLMEDRKRQLEAAQ